MPEKWNAEAIDGIPQVGKKTENKYEEVDRIFSELFLELCSEDRLNNFVEARVKKKYEYIKAIIDIDIIEIIDTLIITEINYSSNPIGKIREGDQIYIK